MATSLQTNHGLGYYAPSDITSWLNGFNPLVLKLETLLTNMDEVDQELRDDLTQGLADLNTEITNIKSSNTVQDSNILALQTAITNINNIITDINNNITDIQDSISNINDSLTYEEINLPSILGLTGWCNKNIGKAINFTGTLSTALTANGDYNLATLPAEYRPKRGFAKTICLSSTDNIVAVFSISTGGQVSMSPKANVPSGRWISIYETFI